MDLFHARTEGKTNEELILELREAERRFLCLLETPRFCSLIVDTEMVISFANSHFLNLIGYQRDELLGRNFAETLIPAEKRDQVKNIHTMCINGLVDFLSYFETEIITKQGKRLCFGWNNNILRDAKGAVVATLSSGEDITEKRKTQTKKPTTTVSTASPKAETPEPSSEENETMVCDYVVKKSLDPTSKVRLGVHPITQEKVAIKVLRKNVMTSAELGRARREIEILRLVNSFENPFIAKFVNAVETETCFYIITEFAGKGELLGHVLQLGGLSESESHRILKQIICALQCLHNNGIVHRDIKHSNILMDDNFNVKIIDFGLSNFVQEGVMRTTFCGTPAYAAPEMLLGNKYYGPEVDMWSLGVVLYSMLTATFPFETISDILTGQFRPPANISVECLDILRRMLQVDRNQRATLNDVISHEWTKKQLNPNEPILYPTPVTKTNSPAMGISSPHSPMMPINTLSSSMISALNQMPMSNTTTTTAPIEELTNTTAMEMNNEAFSDQGDGTQPQKRRKS